MFGYTDPQNKEQNVKNFIIRLILGLAVLALFYGTLLTVLYAALCHPWIVAPPLIVALAYLTGWLLDSA